MSAGRLLKNPFVLLGGAAIYVGATGAAYLTFYEPKKGENVVKEISNDERLRVFNANASKYDKGESSG